jgi:hypothetical protein
MKRYILLISLLLTGSIVSAQQPFSKGRLKVSDNQRYLVHSDGTPFFWLGDTAWELFHRLTKQEAEQYLKHRAKQGFTVVQAVALAELDGLNVPKCRGQQAADQ